MDPSTLANLGRLLWWTHVAILIGTVVSVAGLFANSDDLSYFGLTPAILILPATLFGYVAFASILAGFAYEDEHRRLGVAFFVLAGIASSAFLAPCCFASLAA